MHYFIKLLFILLLSTYAYANQLKKVNLQLQWKYQFQFAGFLMAKEKGFYEDIGLDVTIKEWANNIEPVQELVEQKSDYALVRPSSLIDISKGKNIIYLAAIFQDSPLVVLADKSSGIKTIEDFKNKRLMSTGDLNSDVSLIAMMFSHNINFDKIKLQKPTFNVKDLLEKKTDLQSAYISNEPFVLKELGGDPIIFNPKDYGFHFYSDILATSKEYLENNPNEVNRFTQASIKGWEYAFSNINETIDIIYNKYNSMNKSKKALIYEANELKKLIYDEKDEIGSIEKHRLERIFDIYKVLGLVQKNLDLENHLYKNTYTILNKNEKAYLQDKQTILMCVDPMWMPFEKLEKGVHKGLAAEYFKFFSDQLSVDFKVVPTKTWNQSLEFAKERKCDIISLAIPTKDRKEYLRFTSAYIKTPLVIVTKLNVSFINDISNLKNKKVGIPKGYNFAQILKKKYPYLNLIEVTNEAEGLEMVSDNKLFAYIGSFTTVEYVFQEKYYNELKIAGKLNDTWELGVAVRNDDYILYNILEKAINSLDAKQRESIIERWKSSNYKVVTDYSLIFKILSIALVLALFFFYKHQILKRSMKETNELMNATLEGIVFSKGKIIQDANKSTLNMLGLSSSRDIMGRPLSDFIAKESLDLAYNKLYTDDTEPYEVTLIKNDGTKFNALVRGYSLKSRDIRISSFIDITELKNQEKLLVEQSKMMALGDMLSNIAHQWRQPLAAITAASTGMKLQKEHNQLTDSMFYEYCNVINNYSQYLSKTIDDFKNYAEGDTLQIKFNLKKDTKSFLILVESFTKQNNIDIKLIADENIEVFGYPNQLIQCLINLFYNANDALMQIDVTQRYIEIKEYIEENHVVIEFKDNGGGIKNENLSKIFEPYFTTKHKSQGTGLGLHMTYNLIVNSMKGSINVENTNFTYKGVNFNGALFTIKIPLS